MSVATPNQIVAASIRRRRRLFGGSALCGASLSLALAAQGQTLPAIPVPGNIVISAGGAQPTITAPNANALDVNLLATRTVINWDSFHVSGADSVTFHFGQSTDIVLNKSPTVVTIDAGGQVSGLVGAAAGGNIWFYSPQGVVISPGAVMTAGNFVFGRGAAVVDLDFVDATSPLSVLRTASDALIQIDTITSATTASINATGDLVLSAASGDINATTALAAGTATVTATAGSVTVGELTATNGAATVTASGGSVSVSTASAGSASGDITLTAGTTASLGSATAGRDIKVIGPTASLGSGTAGGDVFVTATTGTASVSGAVTAGDDIEVTATTGSVTAGGSNLTSSGIGAADDAHVLVRSTGGSVVAGTAITQGTGVARGDITVQGATTASLGSGTSTRDIKVLGPAASLGSGMAAGDVFVTATTGAASVIGTVTAGDDIEVTATTGAVSASGASLISTGIGAVDDAHVLVRSTGSSVDIGSAITQGTGAALGDVRVEGVTAASLGTGTSSRDVIVGGPAASLGSGSAARDVFVTATTGAASVTGTVTAGDDIEVTATSGSVIAGGASLTSTGVGATDEAHVLARSLSASVTLGSATTQGTGAALGDVNIEAATLASLGSGTSVRDIKVTGPAASLGSGTAAGDVFVTATTGAATVTGTVSAGDDIEVTATAGAVVASGASLTSTGIGAADDAHVLVRSTGSSVEVGSATTQGTGAALGDVNMDAGTTASLMSGSSTRDIKVLGPAASLGSGAAGRDVFVTSTTGAASVTGTVTAGDDIEVTATTGPVIASASSLTSTGVGATDDAHVLVRSTTGSVSVGAASTQGSGTAKGDVNIESTTTASLSSGVSTRDIKVLAPSASLGSATAAGDVFLTATTGAATVTGTVTAGDDIEVTATTGTVLASGAGLTSTGVGASDDAHVLVRSASSSIAVGSAISQGTGAASGDVTLEASTTVTLIGAATSSRDVQLLAGDDVLAGGSVMNAGRDLVARANTGSVTVGTARADDDIALRALTGSVTATGDLQAGRTRAVGDPDTSGAADALLGVTMVGHDLDIKAQVIAVAGHAAAGRSPDANETLGAAQLASDVIILATNADPSPGVAALRLATDSGKLVTAHQDIILRTQNGVAASVQTGGLSAGRDVAVYSPAGSIALGSALAGDDVVLRAPNGSINVTGDVKAGRDVPGMTPVDATGAADDLNSALPFQDFDGNPATIFSVVGFDVSLISQSITIIGSTVAGRQPSTDDPDTPGAVDATTSDVRIETRVTATPVANLAPNIVLGAVTATRDLQIDSAKAVTTGDLKAGRDIAVLGRGGVTPGAAPGDHTGSGVTLGSAHAGDDALAFSVYGRTHVLGGVTSGQPFQRLVPTNNRIIDGATEAADQLAIYLRYFDLDDASAPYVLSGGVIHVAGVGVEVGGNLTAQGATSDVRIRSSADIVVTGDTSAGGYAVFQTDAGVGGSVKVGGVTAGRDVLLDGGAGAGVNGVEATGTLTAINGDVAVRARDGRAISLAGISASDDVVIRGTAQVTIAGPVATGGGADAPGLGDTLRTSDGTVVLEGQTFDLTGSDIDIQAASVTTTGAMTASGAESDVRVQAAGVISLGAASAGRDVLVDGASSVSTGQLAAGRDVGVRSLGVGVAVTVGGATAGDDVVIRANGAISVTRPLSAGGGADSAAADQAGDLMFGVAKSQLPGDLDLVGQMVDVRSGAGSILVTAATSAATDARFQTGIATGGSVTTGAVTAGRNVLLDGSGATATGTLTSTGGDVAVRARDGAAINLAGISAGDDVVVRGTAQVTISGQVNAGGAADSIGFGDVLRTTDGAVMLEGQTFDLTGNDIDVLAASVTTTGAMMASGATSDVRVRAAGVISLGAAIAGRDVLVDGGAAVTTGVLVAGRDVGVRSIGTGSAVIVGGATAGDDVVIRAKGAITVTGALNAGGGIDSVAADQAGDLMFGVAKSRLAGDLDLAGRTVDVRSSAGSIQVSGITNATTDARFQTQATTGGSVKVATVTAGRDILLDGGTGAGVSGAEATGRLTATSGDVAVRARDGKAIQLAGIGAGDDVVLRATGSITATGLVETTGRPSATGLADRLVDSSEAGALSVGGLTFDLSGSDIDVIGDGVNIFRTNAFGSARIKAGSVSVNGGATVGVDILIDSGASLTVGDLSALGDIALRSRNGSLSVGRLVAGDDIVLRAAMGVTAISLRTGGVERLGVGDQLFASDPTMLGEVLGLQGNNIDVKSGGGAIALGSADATGDVRLQATGDVSATGAVVAGRDIMADGGSVTMTGSLTAGGDVALYGRSGRVSLGSVTAGDDIVVRASGDVTSSGILKSGQGADAVGVGDRLIAATSAPGLAGSQPDTGGVIDIGGASLTLHGALSAGGSGGSVRLQSLGAATLVEVTSAGDLLVDAGGDVSTGVLNAGGDIALRSTGGAVSIRSASAGDDIVIRAARAVTMSGQVTTLGRRDIDGAGDRLFALDRMALSGDFDLVGQTVDIRSTSAGITATGQLKGTNDVRLQASDGLITASDVSAWRDVLLDGSAVRAGAVQAGRDIAARARTGSIALASAQVGDDLVLRAATGIAVTDVARATGVVDGDGAGDRLFATDRSALSGDFDLTGSNIDLKSTSGNVAISGLLTAVDDIRLLAAGGAVITGDLSAGRDLVIDAVSVDSAGVKAGRDIAVRAGSIVLQSAAAGDDLVLRASGDIKVAGSSTAQGAADADGAGDRLFATDRTMLNGDLALAGANVDVKGRGTIVMGGTVTAGQDTRFQTVGDGSISLASVTAGGDVLADGRAVQASGQLNAGRDVALRGRAGGVEVAAITAGDDIAIRATGTVKATGALSSGSGATVPGAADRLISTAESGMISRLVDPTAATASIEGFTLGAGDIDIRSGEAISLGGNVTAAGTSSIRLQAGTRLSLAGVTAGDTIFARSRDLALGGAWRAMTARIEVTAAGGLALGEDVARPGDGLSLSSAQVRLIDASRLQFFVGDSSGAMRGTVLAIGAFAVDTTRIKTSLELYAGSLAEVRISGAFAPASGATNTTSVRIGAPNAGVGGWTPQSIKVIANNGGSIGSSATTGGRTFTDVRAFASVELNARGDILMGYQDFIDKLAATQAVSVPGVVRSLIAPQTAAGPRMLITAGSLTLRADGKVAQQDTGGLLGLAPTGIYLLGTVPGKPQLLLGRTSRLAPGGTGLPEYIELNGALTSGTTVMTGQSVSLSNAIAFESGVTPSQFYRLNTCAILQQGSCTPSTGQSNISIAPDQLTGLTLDDRTAAAGTADPTVASATNEEVWKDPD